MLRTALIAAALVAGFIAFAARGPPRPVSASAPEDVFSAERAMRHVRAMAERPHPPGTADHARVRDYVSSELGKLGVVPELQRTTAVGRRFPVAGRVENVVARLPGQVPGGPAILLVTHYDGVGAGPAASDDASGCAAQLEVLRALKFGAPLKHDVIFLFTDLEEAGLLGASAFVAEHRRAKDVEAVINLEARGTGGVATMFQTGPGNLDLLRLLGTLPEVAGSSIAVTLYQYLPNDTDLSELFLLGKPALNFAFADGVERYHTSQDDPEHLDPGSVQQEGAAALGMIRALGSGPLPRPRSGNGVFFELPLVGLTVYPEAWALPLAALSLALTVFAVLRVRRRESRWLRGLGLGLVAMLVAAALSALAAHGLGKGVPASVAAPMARGAYLLGLATLAVASSLLCWVVVRRWCSLTAAALGPLVVWTALSVLASWKAPGFSYVVVWPALAAALAAASDRPPWSPAARWLSLAFSGLLVVPLLYGISVVAFGPVGLGGTVFSGLVALTVWLTALTFERLLAGRLARQLAVVAAVGLAAVGVGVGLGLRATDFPGRSILVHAQDADAGEAWLASPVAYSGSGSWSAEGLGATARVVMVDSPPGADLPPRWLTAMTSWSMGMLATAAPRASSAPPDLVVLADEVEDDVRHLELSIRPGAPAVSMFLRLVNAQVLGASVNGQVIDGSGYRHPQAGWQLTFSAPPEDGFTLDLRLRKSATPTLEVLRHVSGLPTLPGMSLPPRPANVLPSQTGDLTVVRRSFAL